MFFGRAVVFALVFKKPQKVEEMCTVQEQVIHTKGGK